MAEFYRNISFNPSGGYGQKATVSSKYGEGVYLTVGAVGYSTDGESWAYKFVANEAGYSTYNSVKNSFYQIRLWELTSGAMTEGQGSFLANVVAENGTYPTNGKHTDGYWYVRGSLYNTPPSVPGTISATGDFKPNGTLDVTWSASTDAEGNAISYQSEWRIYKSGVAQAWQGSILSGVRTRSVQIPNDVAITAIEFRVRALDADYSAYRNSQVYPVTSNSAPTININTTDNRTLYENDVITIDGQASDTDNGNIVNVKYSINGGTARAIMVDISDGTKSMPFNRQLTFKGGKLYEGETAISGALYEGTAHQLKVWAEDDKDGKSAEQIRTFYVVPNRAPKLTVNPFAPQSDLINADSVTFSGSTFDSDGNDMVVSYKLNGGLATEVYRGKDGEWSFDVKLKDLKDGENTVGIETVDSYNSKYSETRKINKTANLTPLSKSVQRYKIVSPTGSAQGVLLWIQREESATVSAEISMTNGTEQEAYSAMTLSNTAPVSLDIVEDQFQFQSDTAKENIFVKLNFSGGAVTLVSGVLS
ncbi:hypothetical protein [Psychrobacillus sp. NPDC096389]|uniref:hypothetical protein n=1 Tax=Psychrobacillus sp. NPDC096389 TaxID=3364490 RepID=UPI00382D4A1A